MAVAHWSGPGTHRKIPHATAGVALMEVGSGSEQDLAEALVRLLPRDDRYAHRHGATGHGADHVLPALISPSLCAVANASAIAPWDRNETGP